MSEKNNIFENDLLMREILENGQEEVPAHVWDGVSKGLDKAAGKTVVLRWRRVAVSVAAVAAAVAAVLVLDRPQTTDIVPAAMHEDMIAVVETEAPETVKEKPETEAAGNVVPDEPVEAISKTSGARLLAYVQENADSEVIITQEDTDIQEIVTVQETQETQEIQETQETQEIQEILTERQVHEPVQAEQKELFPEVWEEEPTPARRKVRTSMTVSGITGASGTNGRPRPGVMRAPALTLKPAKTGIKEKNTPSRYGLPLSVGVGVKVDFTPRWSLGIGLNYTYLTRTFNGTYTHVNESGIIDNLITSDIRNSQHYLGIPVNAYFNIIDSRFINFYAYAGGTVEKCIYDKYLILSNPITHKEPSQGVQFSANIGIGAEFMLGELVGLYVDPSLRYYFDCNQPKSIRTEQPLMLGFELGFRFRL